ncbi:hypothetical protein MG293_016365 [Ovis ammon polii]|uniref:Uncharacterized protein n=1 Tax=Ovis ammon polii TaxID=230172 RepID=A0AAD4TTZ8_OVIAM|nr:hypothetical protein MG293_016365 [Ovis ammon polii]
MFKVKEYGQRVRARGLVQDSETGFAQLCLELNNVSWGHKPMTLVEFFVFSWKMLNTISSGVKSKKDACTSNQLDLELGVAFQMSPRITKQYHLPSVFICPNVPPNAHQPVVFSAPVATLPTRMGVMSSEERVFLLVMSAVDAEQEKEKPLDQSPP